MRGWPPPSAGGLLPTRAIRGDSTITSSPVNENGHQALSAQLFQLGRIRRTTLDGKFDGFIQDLRLLETF
jgi:hypothetical protein